MHKILDNVISHFRELKLRRFQGLLHIQMAFRLHDEDFSKCIPFAETAKRIKWQVFRKQEYFQAFLCPPSGSVYNYRFVMRMLPECVNFFLQRFVIFRHKIISIFANVVEPSCSNFFTVVVIGKCLKNIHTGEHFCCFLYMHLLYPDWPLHLCLFFTSDLFDTVTSLSSLSALICDFTKLWKLQV